MGDAALPKAVLTHLVIVTLGVLTTVAEAHKIFTLTRRTGGGVHHVFDRRQPLE